MSLSRYTSAILALSVAFIAPIDAKPNKKPRKKTGSERKQALTPEEQLKTFTLPEGFVIELVASEENGLVNPIDITFDDAGKLWTQTAEMYPLDPNSKLSWKESMEDLKEGATKIPPEFKKIRDLYQLKTRGTDRILVIEDPTKKATGQLPAFAEGLTIPQSLLPYKDGVFVAHGSEMLFFEDKDGDGKSDTHETILTGFGFTDTHTMSHTLVRGPGGWVHFSHGALNKGKITAPASGNSEIVKFSKIGRFSLDGNDIEVVNNGLQNIWGFQLKANGQWYGTEANDLFYSLIPLHPKMGYKGIGNDKLSPYQPFPGPFHDFKVNGTGISGLAYDENGKSGFPEKWKNIGFLANPITNTINCVIADRNADGSVISEHRKDFLACSDDWFRPVNIEFGPDGCLYVVDWYNKIVSHNEVARDHPDRDKTHGRLWRIRHESQKPAPVPNIVKASNEDLLKHLAADILWEKRAAWHQIADRQAQELAPALSRMAKDTSQTLSTRILALWSLESLRSYDLDLMKALLADKDPDLRREALRSLITFEPSIEDIVTLTQPFIDDPHYMVREQVLRTLGEVDTANEETIGMLVSAANPEVKKDNEFGGGYENNFQRFLALLALEKFPSQLEAFLSSPAAKNVPAANLNEAAQVLPKGERTDNILAAIKSGKAKLDQNTLVALSESFDEPKVLDALADMLPTREFVQLALDAQPLLRSASLTKALEPGLKKLITSSPEDQKMALDAAIRFQSPAINAEVLKLIGSKPLSEVSPQLVDALIVSPKANQAGLLKLAKDASVPINLRLKAIFALPNRKEANGIFTSLYEAADDATRASMVSSAIGNTKGGASVMGLINRKQLSPTALDLAEAEKLTQLFPRNPAAKILAPRVAQLSKEDSAAADERIKSYTKAAKTLEGNPAVGEGMFNACLACHQAGGKGHELAPALDGSSNRELDHLLVAIVKPSEAMEGGYKVYRIIKTNGDILEGSMFNTNKNGTTLAYMGGATQFIPKEQIKSEQFVSNRSFMPTSFGSLPEQTMVDLLTYIKTLK